MKLNKASVNILGLILIVIYNVKGARLRSNAIWNFNDLAPVQTEIAT